MPNSKLPTYAVPTAGLMATESGKLAVGSFGSTRPQPKLVKRLQMAPTITDRLESKKFAV
jgi:hypothetical protein